MHSRAIVLVLLSALLHATWNAQLKGHDDRTQFMANMSTAIGLLALLCVAFLPLPASASWGYVALSAMLHLGYNVLLLETYKRNDFGSAYPMARGISPFLVTLGAFLFMHQRPTSFGIAGILMISMGIVSLALEKAGSGAGAKLPAVATGASIAAYTVVDGMGVQRAGNTFAYTAWVFASYLLMPMVIRLLGLPVQRMEIRHSVRPVIAAICSLAAYTLVLWATQYVEVGIVSALRETSVLWAVILSSMFLGEAFAWRRLASAMIICLGVALLLAR